MVLWQQNCISTNLYYLLIANVIHKCVVKLLFTAQLLGIVSGSHVNILCMHLYIMCAHQNWGVPRMSNPRMSNPKMSNPKMSNPIMSNPSLKMSNNYFNIVNDF